MGFDGFSFGLLLCLSGLYIACSLSYLPLSRYNILFSTIHLPARLKERQQYLPYSFRAIYQLLIGIFLSTQFDDHTALYPRRLGFLLFEAPSRRLLPNSFDSNFRNNRFSSSSLSEPESEISDSHSGGALGVDDLSLVVFGSTFLAFLLYLMGLSSGGRIG
jgi:hypothetical protein